MHRSKIGFVTGLTAEAKLLRNTNFPVEAGGGTPAGAALAATRLLEKNVSAIISFGLAGGLNPALRPGALCISARIIESETVFQCDNELLNYLGGATADLILAADAIAETANKKQLLYKHSGANAVDLESGAVARIATSAGLPFATFRAIADPAERDLPQAALIALNAAGAIQLGPILASVARNPTQIPSLLSIAQDAAKARATLLRHLGQLPES